MDRIGELGEQAGLSALEKKHAKDSNGRRFVYGERPGGTDRDKDISYTVVGEMCSDLPLVRKHMESGVLASMSADWKKKMTAPNSDSQWPNPSYFFVLLGACAMSLGCRLPDAYKAALRNKFRNAGLMRDALTQMDTALNDPERGYKNGKPYDFGSAMSPDAAMQAGGRVQEDLLYPNSMTMNCRAPFSMPPLSEGSLLQIRRNVLNKSFGSKSFQEVIVKVHSMYLPDELYTIPELKHNFLYTYPSGTSICIVSPSDVSPPMIRSMPVMPDDYMMELKAQLELIVRVAEMTDVTDKTCGNCGAEEGGNAKPLRQCAKCKKQKYCTRVCQEAHWKQHKKDCGRLASGKPNTGTHPSLAALLEAAKKQAGA